MKRDSTSITCNGYIQTQVKLVVESERMTCDDMVDIFRTKPTKSWSVGDARTNSGRIFETNGVQFSSGKICIEEQLRDISVMLEQADFDVLSSARDILIGEIRIGVDSYKDDEFSFVFPPQFMAIADKLLMPVDIDMLYLSESEESDAPYKSFASLTLERMGMSDVLFKRRGANAVSCLFQRLMLSLNNMPHNGLYDRWVLKVIGERPIIAFPCGFFHVCRHLSKEFAVSVMPRLPSRSD